MPFYGSDAMYHGYRACNPGQVDRYYYQHVEDRMNMMSVQTGQDYFVPRQYMMVAPHTDHLPRPDANLYKVIKEDNISVRSIVASDEKFEEVI
ncbi:hypothetical protein Ciccas_007150 [Cichlidogyrus casuarinus]|uniref:Uncharacterized protein n=1 Tax=Cichlidogyrus casuarinus TaxID=1844966 RepID=A0ABD2Q3P8_9PLAT